MIMNELCVLSFIYIYIAVCRFCTVRRITIICFYLLVSNYSTYVLEYWFFKNFLVCKFFSCFVYSGLLYCFVHCFSLVYRCLSPIFEQVYRPLPPGSNPMAMNKYHIISYHIIYRIISYIISYIMYNIISYQNHATERDESGPFHCSPLLSKTHNFTFQ